MGHEALLPALLPPAGPLHMRSQLSTRKRTSGSTRKKTLTSNPGGGVSSNPTQARSRTPFRARRIISPQDAAASAFSNAHPHNMANLTITGTSARKAMESRLKTCQCDMPWHSGTNGTATHIMAICAIIGAEKSFFDSMKIPLNDIWHGSCIMGFHGHALTLLHPAPCGLPCPPDHAAADDGGTGSRSGRAARPHAAG